MSEFNPFGAADEAPAYVAEAPEETAESRRNVVLLGALAAVVLGAGAYLFLGGDSVEEEVFTPAARAPRAAAPAATAPPAAKVPGASKVTLGRNPFRALYVAPAAAAAAAPAAPAAAAPAPAAPAPVANTGGTAPTVVFVGNAPAGGSTSGGNAAPAQPAPAQPAPKPAPAQSTVALKSVAAGKDGANPTATFDYDGKTVTGAPGDVMEGKLLVISLQQDSTGSWFANLQLGDGSPFEVHERQTVVVQ